MMTIALVTAWNGNKHFRYEMKYGKSAFTPSSEFIKDIFGPEYDDWQGITFVFDTAIMARNGQLEFTFDCKTEGIKRIETVSLSFDGLQDYCDRELIVLGDL